MNMLSVFLLLSDIVPRLAILGIILIVAALALLFVLPKNDEIEMFSYEHAPFQGLMRKEPYIVGIIGLVLLFFTPSKEAFRLIAASQVGEQIIQLEEVQEIGGEVGGLAKDAIELLRQQVNNNLPQKPTE